VTEEGQQPVALGDADVAAVPLDDPLHVATVASDDRAISLRLDRCRQCRRINQICEKDCDSADLARVGRGGE
jgi:hypothetical protein